MARINAALGKEDRCAACGGTGLAKVEQLTKPGSRIFPPKCKECAGKGRIRADNLTK
jgi:DnaJ-class molecular chaperone